MNREGLSRFRREGPVLFRLALKLIPRPDQTSPQGLAPPENIEKSPCNGLIPYLWWGAFVGFLFDRRRGYAFPYQAEGVCTEEGFHEKPIDQANVPARRS